MNLWKIGRYLGLMVFLSSGCSSFQGAKKVSNLEASLSQIGKAISASFPGGIATQSENGRTFRSGYFDRELDPEFDPKEIRERFVAQAVILGERRPYDVEMVVYKQVKKSKTSEFSPAKPSAEYTNKVFKRFKEKLHQGMDGRNFIDDFRAF